MTEKQAVEFCESVSDCKYCPIVIYELDKRSKAEWEAQVPCCVNLIGHSDWNGGKDE